MTQAQVAGKLGVRPATYGHYEEGLRTPDVDMALRIARILGRPVEELFGDLADAEARCEQRNSATSG